MADKIKESEFVGIGCLFQGVGLLVCVFGLVYFGIYGGFIFLVIGLVLAHAGGKQNKVYRCGECMNKVDQQSKMCPTCKINLD